MKCSTCQGWLSPLLEGELSAPRQRAVEGHLSSCAACRQEKEALEKMCQMLAQLPQEEGPPEGWSRLEAALDLEDARRAKEDPLSWKEPQAAPHKRALHKRSKEREGLFGKGAGSRSFEKRGFSWWTGGLAFGAGLAAMLLLLLATGHLSLDESSPGRGKQGTSLGNPLPSRRSASERRPLVALGRQRQPPRPPPRTLPSRSPLSPLAVTSRRPLPRVQRQRPGASPGPSPALRAALAELRRAHGHYQQALALLERAAGPHLRARTRRGQLLRQTLAELDRAIALCREAIRQEPQSPEPRRMLLAVYQRKIEVLRDVVLGQI